MTQVRPKLEFRPKLVGFWSNLGFSGRRNKIHTGTLIEGLAEPMRVDHNIYNAAPGRLKRNFREQLANNVCALCVRAPRAVVLRVANVRRTPRGNLAKYRAGDGAVVCACRRARETP